MIHDERAAEQEHLMVGELESFFSAEVLWLGKSPRMTATAEVDRKEFGELVERLREAVEA